MPSEKVTPKGLCGHVLKGSRWKQGQSLECSIDGMTMVSYPRVDTWEAVRHFCRNCTNNPGRSKH